VGAHRKDGRLPAVTFYPNRETLEAILKAAAIVACADGQVSSLERLSLMSFLGRHGILAREGRAASAVAFDEAVREVALLRLDEACAAADGFRRIAGRPGASLVANAAAVVALADGIGWPQEIALLEVIRDRLGLRAGHQTPYTMSEG
jgi:tellurite resistance protein